jgi:hypothetical protein
MKRLAILFAALLAACGPKSHEPAGGGGGVGDDRVRKVAWDPELVAGLLEDLKKEVGCPSATSKHRLWCIAADGWEGGAAGELPASGLYVGLTLSLADGEPVGDWLETGVTFSALGVRADGGVHKARVAALVPSNQEEAELITPAAESVTAVLRAEAKEVTLPKDLVTYLADLPAAADYEMTRGEKGWTWTGAAATELRRVGDFWVAIEVPPDGPPGILVSIFTDRIAR